MWRYNNNPVNLAHHLLLSPSCVKNSILNDCTDVFLTGKETTMWKPVWKIPKLSPVSFPSVFYAVTRIVVLSSSLSWGSGKLGLVALNSYDLLHILTFSLGACEQKFQELLLLLGLCGSPMGQGFFYLYLGPRFHRDFANPKKKVILINKLWALWNDQCFEM